jgi:hypothetical protein
MSLEIAESISWVLGIMAFLQCLAHAVFEMFLMLVNFHELSSPYGLAVGDHLPVPSGILLIILRHEQALSIDAKSASQVEVYIPFTQSHSLRALRWSAIYGT